MVAMSSSNTRHGQKFDEMCVEVGELLRQKPWRTALQPRTVVILTGIHTGLETPAILAACRALYEDYAAVRVANAALFRIFRRILRGM